MIADALNDDLFEISLKNLHSCKQQETKAKPEVDKNYLCYAKGVLGEVKPKLVIVENISALVSISRILDSRKYIILALQGKPDNVTKYADNESLIEETLIVKRLREAFCVPAPTKLTVDAIKKRFSEILLVFDSDVDGLHITALTLNCFRTICPTMFNQDTQHSLVSVIMLPNVQLQSPYFNETRSFFSETIAKMVNATGQYILTKIKSKCGRCHSVITFYNPFIFPLSFILPRRRLVYWWRVGSRLSCASHLSDQPIAGRRWLSLPEPHFLQERKWLALQYGKPYGFLYWFGQTGWIHIAPTLRSIRNVLVHEGGLSASRARLCRWTHPGSSKDCVQVDRAGKEVPPTNWKISLGLCQWSVFRAWPWIAATSRHPNGSGYEGHKAIR